ncbi:hypothetical protein SKAU_G00137610 [Synaphobranchus kaupii]|uniref:Nuclease HARBI1 n=1 Tax=Synaphobranchus kaupii TaxID=118154 RepID=A0A9Q1FRL1_SYNKA|nr:hypothetical protein SKAU_G00137610 [Synaphobranchus kaupii]
MAALALLEDIANRAIRRERVFRDRADFFAHDDEWLISRYHLPRATLLELCAQMGPNLQTRTNCNQAIPVEVQVLTILGFLATGTFQREIGDRSGISQPSVSRIMPAVLRGIIRLSRQYIKFPYTAEELQNVKDDFVRTTGFPNVIERRQIIPWPDSDSQTWMMVRAGKIPPVRECPRWLLLPFGRQICLGLFSRWSGSSSV